MANPNNPTETKRKKMKRQRVPLSGNKPKCCERLSRLWKLNSYSPKTLRLADCLYIVVSRAYLPEVRALERDARVKGYIQELQQNPAVRCKRNTRQFRPIFGYRFSRFRLSLPRSSLELPEVTAVSRARSYLSGAHVSHESVPECSPTMR